jgi:hypothetical protein
VNSRLVVAIVLELISVACVVHLLVRRDPLWKRLVWIPAVLLPIVGPLLYGALYTPPTGVDGPGPQHDLKYVR